MDDYDDSRVLQAPLVKKERPFLSFGSRRTGYERRVFPAFSPHGIRRRLFDSALRRALSKRPERRAPSLPPAPLVNHAWWNHFLLDFLGNLSRGRIGPPRSVAYATSTPRAAGTLRFAEAEQLRAVRRRRLA